MIIVKASKKDKAYFYRALNKNTSLIADLTAMTREINFCGEPVCLIISVNNYNKFKEIHPFFDYEKSTARMKFGSAFRLKDPRKTFIFVSDKLDDEHVYGFFKLGFEEGGLADFKDAVKLIANSEVLNNIYDADKYKALVSMLFK